MSQKPSEKPQNTSTPLPASDREAGKAPGHWLLARVGKKVLRPGGRETTEWVINHLPVEGHAVVEFAPGLGVTAAELLARKPSSYVGVDADADACAITGAKLPQNNPNFRMQLGSAKETNLEAGSADVVIGEAMLTMQTDKHKLEIMREAHRILRPGGRYGIHELGLHPDNLDPVIKNRIQKDLARAIKVNARPLTTAEWTELAEEAGFRVVDVYHAPMALLEPKRMVADEGLPRTLKIIFNVLRQPEIRKRVMTMRRTFTTYADNLNAIGMVLERK
ncbi:methyltransferase domain-containing protein [Corynebacterium sp. CCM 9186]|uniref:class I SAM-dependent methyltransferase n=1 Tax=Corynebacterium meridianum TaxID=2765363 RepID=UPI002004B634|nr:class I SAM-dependent methyltransferase [Corynebacterium meridianum]MCK7676829.1 methyltransferase domain-containing protein [Corynebacterium meridianum]